VLPLLVGTGKPIYDNGKWLGDSQNIKDVLGMYQRIYGSGLGDPVLQQEAKGRDKSFAEFADNKIGILLESGYFWRSVVEPNKGVLSGDPMLSFVATKVLPVTRFRPGLADYTKVSAALQQATADVISGKSPDQAAAGYQDALVKAVGADKVAGG